MAKLNARNTPILAACKAKFNAGYYRECLAHANADPSLMGLWEYVKTLTSPSNRTDALIQEWLCLADADLPTPVRDAKDAERLAPLFEAIREGRAYLDTAFGRYRVVGYNPESGWATCNNGTDPLNVRSFLIGDAGRIQIEPRPEPSPDPEPEADDELAPCELVEPEPTRSPLGGPGGALDAAIGAAMLGSLSWLTESNPATRAVAPIWGGAPGDDLAERAADRGGPGPEDEVPDVESDDDDEPEPTPDPDSGPTFPPSIGRDEAIRRIRAALRRRSGKAWSVKGGRGTAWGWIRIDAPPARCTWQWAQTSTPEPPAPGAVYRGAVGITPYRHGDDAITCYDDDPWAREAVESGQQVCFDWEVDDPAREFGHASPADRAELADLLGLESVHYQGHSIPASGDYYAEYVDRAEGREPATFGTQYWD